MKRTVCSIIILLSMMLHSASRLGIVSYLYQKRHTFAYNIGLIAEVPIAMCSADHSLNESLVIDDPEDERELPANFFQSREIILFIQDIASDLITPPCRMDELHFTAFLELKYPSPIIPLFQPPREG